MTFLAKIAPKLIPIIERDDIERDDSDDDNFLGIKDFSYRLRPYVSQVEGKIYSILKIDSWNWRLAIVGIVVLRITIIPFHLVEASVAGLFAFFAFLPTRDLNHHEFRHLTCWVGENIEEVFMSCVSPIAGIFALWVGGMCQEMFSRLER